LGEAKSHSIAVGKKSSISMRETMGIHEFDLMEIDEALEIG
jgi:hypothetical protein